MRFCFKCLIKVCCMCMDCVEDKWVMHNLKGAPTVIWLIVLDCNVFVLLVEVQERLEKTKNI